ncbi:FAD-dependent oxidoreductase [Nonomuraea antimicrobica]
MNEPLRVLIAGAGLGGLCLAQRLHQAGVDVLVLERDAGPYSRAQGHRVHIDQRGEDALRACLPGPLFELYQATRGQPSERMMLINAEGARLQEVPLPALPDGTSIIRTGRAVSRNTLREILLGGLDGVVRFGKAFTRYEQDGEGRSGPGSPTAPARAATSWSVPTGSAQPYAVSACRKRGWRIWRSGGSAARARSPARSNARSRTGSSTPSRP